MARRKSSGIPDVADEPSVEWGWHQHFPRAARVTGIVVGVIILTLVTAHPATGTEIAYVVGTAALVIGVAIWDAVSHRNSWRR